MEQLKRILTALTFRQKAGIVLVLALVGGAMYGLYHWQRESDFQALYKSLSPEDASAIVLKLKENAVEYRLVDDGSSVLVPSAKVAESRLSLAGAGLPRSGRIGFELFDKSNFGITDFAEHINYRRALEGELERSVMALAEVERARVHLTFPKDSVFLESRQSAKGSVLVSLKAGSLLTPQNVTAITHLIASAVEGLSPDSVSVLDMRGNLLSRPRLTLAGDGEGATDANLDYQQKIERDLAAKIAATLEPLLGAGKFRTGVSADCDFTSGEQSEESLDPSKSVMLTSMKTEDTSGMDLAGGIPGTASNIPRGNGKKASGNSGFVRRTENVTYQSSRTVKRTHLPQGSVKRLSIAVLLDQNMRWEGQGSQAHRIVVPLAPETLKTVQNLVTGVAGMVPERGDRLIVESLPFESTLNSEPPMAPQAPAPNNTFRVPNFREQPKYVLIGGAAAVLIVLLIVGMLIRGMTKSRRRAEAILAHASLPPGGQAEAAIGNARTETSLPQNDYSERPQLASYEQSLKLPAAGATKVESLTAHLRQTANKDTETVVNVLRGWLNEA